MKDQQDAASDRNDLARGLPMFTASAPEVLAKEKAELAELEGKGLLHRWRVYGAKSGPGWRQSALVLGSGRAMAYPRPGVVNALCRSGTKGKAETRPGV